MKVSTDGSIQDASLFILIRNKRYWNVAYTGLRPSSIGLHIIYGALGTNLIYAQCNWVSL